MTSPPSSSPYQSVSTRLRAESAGSQASLQSTDSLASSVSEVASKRHEEFQRYFGARLLDENPGVPAEELLTVVATQSGDLQAKLLLHGRVYLTRHHLCFRCNILGYKRETIHPLTGIRSVKRGTTAKWIQNAVYVIEDGHELGDYTGYGSMADRDAMYESILECWKMAAPERYTDWMDRGSEDELIPSKSVEEEEGEDEPVATTQCSGEDHLGEVALDTVVGMPLDKLYRLVYHDREFIEAFYTRDKGLTGEHDRQRRTLMADLKISEWETKNGHERRTLTYVMHMVSLTSSKLGLMAEQFDRPVGIRLRRLRDYRRHRPLQVLRDRVGDANTRRAVRQQVSHPPSWFVLCATAPTDSQVQDPHAHMPDGRQRKREPGDANVLHDAMRLVVGIVAQVDHHTRRHQGSEGAP